MRYIINYIPKDGFNPSEKSLEFIDKDLTSLKVSENIFIIKLGNITNYYQMYDALKRIINVDDKLFISQLGEHQQSYNFSDLDSQAFDDFMN